MKFDKYKDCIVGTQSFADEFWLVKGNEWFDVYRNIDYFNYCPICGKFIDIEFFEFIRGCAADYLNNHDSSDVDDFFKEFYSRSFKYFRV